MKRIHADRARECGSRGLALSRTGRGPGRQPAIILQYLCRESIRSVTELIRPSVSSVKYGAVDEFGMAGAVNFPGLVESPGVVVESADAGQRPEHRGLVRAVPPAPRTADGRSRRDAGHRVHASALCGLCVRLRLQVVASARGCAADLLVRHLAVQR